MNSRLALALLLLALAGCSSDPADPRNTGADATSGDDTATGGDLGGGGDASVPNGVPNATPGPDTGPMSDMADAPELGQPDLGPPPDPTAGAGAAELVQEGFQFTEGPRWFPNDGVLRFTDIPANTIYELAEPDTITAFTTMSRGANGLGFDGNGNMLAAEHGGRQVALYDGANSSPLIADFQGMAFNSPNDLVRRADGVIYFTDPPYGLGNRTREIPFNGLFRYDPADQSVTAEWEGATATRPNGVVLSPDATVLYLADTADGKVYAFDVAPDGSLSGQRDFVNVSGPDGMAVDVWGNLYVTTDGGIAVFAPDGSSWGRLDVPRRPANCAFGGSDARTLYVTAREGLYRIALQVEGIY